MADYSIRLFKKGLFLAGIAAVLILMGMPANADTLAYPDSQSGIYSGFSPVFLNTYSTSGFSLPESPNLGTGSLISNLQKSQSSGISGTFTGLPTAGDSSGTLSLISNALNTYKTTPMAFTDYSYIAGYMPTCYV